MLPMNNDADFSSFCSSEACPSMCTASSFSGSSPAQPSTPSSRRSSPMSSVDPFSMSEMDMSLPYDLTPPHSASSDQFNCFADPIQLSDLVPMTPSHGQAMGYFYSSSTVAFPPTSSTQSFSSPSFAESFSEGLSHGQLSDGSYTTQPQLPILPSQSIHANYLDTTMWNETPLPMFETPTSPLQNMPNIKREQPVESPTYQAGTQRRRSRAVQDARRNSKALHRVQSGTGRPNAAARNGKRALRSTGSRSTGGHVKVAESAKFHCDAPGCLSGPYERNEHLKRHIKTKHSLDTPIHRCEAARCNAAFDRLDNLRQHLSLHDKERGGAARVKFAEGAAEQLERLQSQMKPRGGGARNKAARTARAA